MKNKNSKNPAQWLKEVLTNNLGWKILSLLASIVLWAVVTTTDNPVVPQSFYNIPVKLVNTDTITALGKMYTIEDNTGIVDKVTIRAPHSVINEIDSEDIIAEADINELSSLDTVSIRFKTTKYEDQINSIVGSSDTLKLKIETKKTKSFNLSVLPTGTIEDGYMIGDIKPAQNQVRITGPESIINSIYQAQTEVDVTGAKADIKTSAEIKLVDKDNNPIASDTLTLNIRSVQVTVNILGIKEVPVSFTYTGEPYQGYEATGVITQDRYSLIISGEESELAKIENISIPGDAIDITGQKDDYVSMVDITKYLPEGITHQDPDGVYFKVSVAIEAQSNKRISLAADDIKLTNIPEGYKATIFLEEDTILELIGLSADLAMASKSNIEPTLDVTEWKMKQGIDVVEDGFYNATVTFTLPGKVKVLDPITATLHIEKIVEEQ